MRFGFAAPQPVNYQARHIPYTPLLGNNGKPQVYSVSEHELSRWRNGAGPPNNAFKAPDRSVSNLSLAAKHVDPGKLRPEPAPSSARKLSKESVTGNLDIVQFASAIFIVDEEEKRLRIDVMRLGRMQGRLSCKFSTKDGSAKEGVKYNANSGELIFEDGESDKSFEVSIIDDDLWSPTLEFKVMLYDPVNCIFGLNLDTARVRIIDNDKFPGNKFKDDIAEGEDGINKINSISLFMEYFWLNYSVPGLRWRTVLTLVMDQWHNLYYIFTLYVVNIYLVNILFVVSQSTEKQLFLQTRPETATLIGALYVALFVLKYIIEYVKIQMDIEGHSRKFLQCCLFRKYLNYSEDSRARVLASDMQIAITQDCPGLAGAYGLLLEIMQILCKLMLTLGFVLMFSSGSIVGTVSVFLLPTVIMIFGYMREEMTLKASEATSAKMTRIIQLTQDVCTNYRLIADYMQRPQMNEIFEDLTTSERNAGLPEHVIKLTNNYFPKLIGVICVGGFILLEAPAVLSGTKHEDGMSLGTFLATVSIFSTVSADSGEVYSLVMKLSEQFPALRTLTLFFNLPTELPDLKVTGQVRRDSSKKARAEILQKKVDPSVEYKSDLIPLKLIDVGWKFPKKVLFENVNTSVDQGKLVAVVGNHGSGKRTLLRLLGHNIFPQTGEVFVPTHLRILHVSQEPTLLSLSPWRNLTFGCVQPVSAQDAARVSWILDRFKMVETKNLVRHELEEYLESTDIDIDCDDNMSSPSSTDRSQVTIGCNNLHQHLSESAPEEQDGEDRPSVEWLAGLTYTEKVMMHLARAFMMNPEVMIMQRPLHHFNRDIGKFVLDIVKEHVKHRGLSCSEHSLNRRRPRTVFYSPETKKQAQQADVVWQIDKERKTVYEIPADRLNDDFAPEGNGALSAGGGSSREVPNQGTPVKNR